MSASPSPGGRYRLIRQLAVGGMGEVFLAQHQGPAGFSKPVVIKRILPHLAWDEGFVEMFLHEARVAAGLSHPNIVQIFDLGREEDGYFIAMEYVQGHSLRALLREQVKRGVSSSPLHVARICSQVLRALHYAHHQKDERGRPRSVIHRDVTPENILVSFEGAVKLADFGLAKASGSVLTTRPGTLKGKYGYMAPEQLERSQVEPRSDVYAVGVVAYELLAGQRPFTGESDMAVAYAIVHHSASPLREHRPDVPEELERIVMKALAKRPEERFESAGAMADALEELIARSGRVFGGKEIAELMERVFGAPVPLSLELSGSVARETTAVVAAEDLTQLDRPLPEMRRRPSWRLWALVGLAAVAVGSAVALVVRSAGASRPSASSAQPSVAVSPAPIPAEPAPVPVEPAPELPKPPAAEVAVRTGAAAPERSRRTQYTPTAVRAERTSRQRERLAARKAEPGKVVFKIRPWAEVFLGEKRLGMTPLPPVELPAGTHTLTLRNHELGVSRRVKVVVPSGREAVVQEDLFSR